ncbi:MAG: hypothetical protein KKC03_06155 [Bacteroidetes bacterium]|nr:hypothetical protein [Bacteroidota bacterium]
MKPEQIFKQYPKIDSFFETSDGAQFFTAQDASAHAGSLKDKKVKEIKRPVKATTPSGEGKGKAAAKSTDKTE